MAITSNTRGAWGSRIGFILAAAGSAVGLGNIWRFPTETAHNGGGAFVVVYLICSFLVGFPVMIAELSLGRKAQKNPYGAFKQLGNNPIYSGIGIWGILCGFFILSFYNVIAGWSFSYVFEELCHGMGWDNMASWFGNTDGGVKTALFSTIFMIFTVTILYRGIKNGIEKATKVLMPLLIFILFVLIVYTMFQPGAAKGYEVYLYPDFSAINANLIFSAMGHAFFSLSLGMGTMITYGSYINKKENVPKAGALVVLADVSIAFLAGLLIIPAMYVAAHYGAQIFDDSGHLVSGPALVFDVLPALFHQIGGLLGTVVGTVFFLLLSIAALTSTISLLEVPVAFTIDELKWNRKKAVLITSSLALFISIIVSIFPNELINILVIIFNNIGLPLGGMLICLFIGYVWGTKPAIEHLSYGYSNIKTTLFVKVWPIFIWFIVPIIIIYILIQQIL